MQVTIGCPKCRTESQQVRPWRPRRRPRRLSARCLQKRRRPEYDAVPPTPPELTQGPVFDLSHDLFLWVTQKHSDNNSAQLVAKYIMSNVALAGLSGTYREIVDMLADAGHQERAAQIWRADVASHMDLFREFLRARKAVERYESLPEEKHKGSAPNRHQLSMAKDFAKKKQLALDAIAAFEARTIRYTVTERHKTQIAQWKTELETKTRGKLAPPNKTKMSEDLL